MSRNHYIDADDRCDVNGALSDSITHLILKAPNLTYEADSIVKYFSNPTCIFTYRDIRDIVVSMGKMTWIPMIKNQLRRIKNKATVAQRFKEDVKALENPATQSHQSCAYIAKIKTDLRDTFDQHGIRKMEVSYENLVRDPDLWRENIWHQVGLPRDRAGSDYTEIMRGWGPGMTYRRNKVNSYSVGQWQNHLSPSQEQEVWDISKATMRSLQYSRKPGKTPSTQLWNSIKSGLKHSPIVATGRGGSGTRLLSVLLQSLNTFPGNTINHSGDSIEWVNILYKIAVERLQTTSKIPGHHWRYQLQETAADILTSANWDGEQLWGWKLPETMLVLPTVFDSFRKAKLIQLVRHPVDTCLRRTHMTSRCDNPVGRSVLRAAYYNLGWDITKVYSDPDYLLNAASWHFQVGEVTRYGREKIGPDNYLEVLYEDVCANPSEARETLADFLHIKISHRPIDIEIDPNRQHQWKPPDKRADEVWDICGKVASQFGYKPLISEL